MLTCPRARGTSSFTFYHKAPHFLDNLIAGELIKTVFGLYGTGYNILEPDSHLSSHDVHYQTSDDIVNVGRDERYVTVVVKFFALESYRLSQTMRKRIPLCRVDDLKLHFIPVAKLECSDLQHGD
jgi:hypothetical protein